MIGKAGQLCICMAAGAASTNHTAPLTSPPSPCRLAPCRPSLCLGASPHTPPPLQAPPLSLVCAGARSCVCLRLHTSMGRTRISWRTWDPPKTPCTTLACPGRLDFMAPACHRHGLNPACMHEPHGLPGLRSACPSIHGGQGPLGLEEFVEAARSQGQFWRAQTGARMQLWPWRGPHKWSCPARQSRRPCLKAVPSIIRAMHEWKQRLAA